MTCGLLDIGCAINGFLAGLWWLPYAVWGLLGVFALVALAKVKELAGWPGVFAVLTLGAYGLGYWRGRRNEPLNPVEHLDPSSPDAARSHQRPKPHQSTKPAARPELDTSTGKFRWP